MEPAEPLKTVNVYPEYAIALRLFRVVYVRRFTIVFGLAAKVKICVIVYSTQDEGIYMSLAALKALFSPRTKANNEHTYIRACLRIFSSCCAFHHQRLAIPSHHTCAAWCARKLCL